ncbi:hypothetical protein CEXT_555721 [Caerostris extrusa]|uniref:Uncharacterized protein n=1 Tax=Caerostris extrusa TaxID=172846 RepID=A0AAV4MGF9_CAEEX|nr:hypothetical protein CEXT_555721 [Caerostris extrusa]
MTSSSVHPKLTLDALPNHSCEFFSTSWTDRSCGRHRRALARERICDSRSTQRSDREPAQSDPRQRGPIVDQGFSGPEKVKDDEILPPAAPKGVFPSGIHPPIPV